MTVKKIEFSEPEPEVVAAPEPEAPAHKLLRIIIHTSHGGDETDVRFYNRLYPEWGPRHLHLKRNEEVIVDSRVLPRLDGKASLTTKVDDKGRPLRDPVSGDIIKIQKLRFPYTIVGEA